MIEIAIRAMPSTAVIISAFDNDRDGAKYALMVTDIAKKLGKRHITHTPSDPHKDWNDVLKFQCVSSMVSPPPDFE